MAFQQLLNFWITNIYTVATRNLWGQIRFILRVLMVAHYSDYTHCCQPTVIASPQPTTIASPQPPKLSPQKIPKESYQQKYSNLISNIPPIAHKQEE